MGKNNGLSAELVLVSLLVALAITGTMDCRDQKAVNEFRLESRVIIDADGEPQLVSVADDRNDLILRGLLEDDDGQAKKAIDD